MKTFYLSLLWLIILVPLESNAQWTKVSNPIPSGIIQSFAIDAVEDCAVIGITYDTDTLSLFKTNDNGNSWIEIKPPFKDRYELPIDISIVDSLHFVVATSNGRIILTADGGTNWEVQFENTELTTFMNYIEMFDLNNGVAMGDAPDFLGEVSDSNKALFLRTTDGGNEWQVMENNINLFGSGDIWKRLDFISPDVGYHSESFAKSDIRGIFKTIDGGNNWNVVNPSGPSGGFHLIKFYDEKLGLLITVGNYPETILLRTLNGGEQWDTLSLEITGYGNDIEFIKNNPAKIWLTDNDNLFFSNDTGTTWSEQTLKSGDLEGRDIVFIDENHGWILTDSDIYYTSTGGTITSIENEKTNIVNNYKLFQNYPNPFNPSTTISFSITKAADVKLNVYNVLGQKVASLVNEFRNAGTHKVNWDASNISSGIYVYTLQAGSKVLTNRMILLK